MSKVNLIDCDIAADCSVAGEVENGEVRAEKTGAFVGTANTNGCVVTLTNCINGTNLKDFGRVINGAMKN